MVNSRIQDQSLRIACTTFATRNWRRSVYVCTTCPQNIHQHPSPQQHLRTHLSTSNKHDRLARHVRHTERRADLVVHRVPLRHEHPVDPALLRAPAHRGEVAQRAVELGQLVDGLVPDEGLADEDDLVRAVRGDELE